MAYRHAPSSLSKALIRLATLVGLFLTATPPLYAGIIVNSRGVSVTPETTVNTPRPYERTVTPTDDGVVIAYRFHYFNADSTAEGYRLSLPKFGDVSREGAPALLRGRDVTDCPRNAVPTLKVHRANYADIQLTLAPATPLYSDNGVPTFSANTPITPYGGFFPTEIVSGLTHQKSRHQSVVMTDVCPFTYSMCDSTLRLCTELIYEIAFNTPAASTPSSDITNQNGLNGAASATSSTDSTGDMSAIPQVDANQKFLIITVPEYADCTDNAPMQRFVRWKRIQGYHTHVASSSSWTPDAILDTIKAHYSSAPDLYYILFVGTHSDVPAITFVERLGTNNYTILTDKYYGCMDGDSDEFTDIARGRWPITSIEELRIIVDKTIDYEKTPPDDPSYYTHATHLAYFEDKGILNHNDKYQFGHTEKRFERTCEEVQNYMEKYHNITVDRLYSATEKGKLINNLSEYPGPLYWEDTYSYNYVSLDTVLTLKDYIWDKSYSQFVDAIQQGRVYALYRGHGNTDGWYNMYFYDSVYEHKFNNDHLRALPECTNTSIVFSITCDTGDFSKDCFANAWLTSKGGAISVIGQSNTGFSGINDVLTIEFFARLWGGLSIPTDLKFYTPPRIQEPILRVGALVDSTLNHIYRSNIVYDIDRTPYTTHVTHCFADPSLMLHTSLPKTMEGIEVMREDSIVSVNTGKFPAYISLYNDRTKETKRIFGNRSSIKCSDPQDVWVHIEKEGYRPFISEGDDTSQEPPVDEEPNKIISITDNLDQTVTIHYRVEESVGSPYLMFQGLVSGFRTEPGLMHSGEGIITLYVSSGYYIVELRGTDTPERLDQQMILVR